MKSRIASIAGILSLLCGVAGIIMGALAINKTKKVGYVDAIKVFGEYKMKLDLEKKEEPVLLSFKSRADSIKYVHDALVKQSGDKAVIQNLEMQIAQLSDQFQTEYARSNKEINEMVWKRLNPAIDEYAKKNKIDLLMGANGMGTVLYGSEQVDYTNDLIKFINSKYQDGN